jgi:hypothetical protein
MATVQDKQLQASSINNLTRLIRAKMPRQGSQAPVLRKQHTALLVDKEEDEEDGLDELLGLAVDSKNTASNKEPAKAPSTFPFLLANNCSKRMPPQPCQNCGSPLHYD